MRAFFLLVLVGNTASKTTAQTNSDSLFLNSIFTETVYSAYWQFPGTWFQYDSTTSLPGLYNSINTIFPFYETDFENCYEQIQAADSVKKDLLINPTMNSYFLSISGAYKQFNPLYTLDFSLNGTSATSYFTYTPVTTNAKIKTAFFIIPGSNNNQTTDLNRGVGYHNTWCYMREFLKTKGDVFILTKPLEDYRALYRNRKKINSGDYYTPGPNSYVYDYLLGENKPYGINYLIESFALIKYLQQKYDKVVVLGCSQGGFATLLSTMYAKTDASVMSSGYSINFDNSASDIYALQRNFGGLINDLKDTVVRERLSQKKTDLLFTYGNNDSYYYQLEHDVHPTQMFFNGYVNQASYFYNYNQHAFPPCTNLDTFLTRVIKKPKIKLTALKECTRDSTHLNLTAVGKLPLMADLYYNSGFLQTVQINTKDTQITLLLPGIYQFRNIKDSDLVVGFDSDSFQYERDSLQNFQIQFNSYQCTSDSVLYTINLDQDQLATSQLYLRVNGSTEIKSLSSFPYVLKEKNNTTIFIDSIVSSNLCKLFMDDTLANQFQQPFFSHGTIQYDCISNSASTSLQTIGSFPPFLFRFKKNNIADSLWMNATTTFNFTNGAYNFVSVTDNNGCSQAINEVNTIQLVPLSYTIDSVTYNCTQHKFQLPLHLSGLGPFTLFYRKNGLDTAIQITSTDTLLYFSNGYYQLDSVLSGSCSKIINPIWSKNLQYTPLSISTGAVAFDCSSAEIEKTVLVQYGRAPYSLYSSFNAMQDTSGLLLGLNTLNLQNGNYYFVGVRDSFNCFVPLNQTEVINYHPLQFQQTDSTYSCDSVKTRLRYQVQGNAPFTLYYKENGAPKQYVFSNSNLELWFGNGVFQLDSIKDQTCAVQLNGFHYTFNHSAFTFYSPYEEYNCDSGKTYFHVYLNGGQTPYTIYYLNNGFNDSLITSSINTTWEVTNGNYQFVKFQDYNGCQQIDPSSFQLNFHPLSYHVGSPLYVCDSNYSKVAITLQGDPPFSIYYRKNGQAQTISTFQNTYWLIMLNGSYTIDSVQDIHCNKVNPPITFNLQQYQLSCTVSNPVYNCTSGLIQTQLSFTGNPPFTLNYSINGIPSTFTTHQTTDVLTLSNGICQFNWVKDSTQCLKTLSQSFSLNYQPLQEVVNNPVYRCDSAKAAITLHFSGNAPYQLFYHENGLAKQVLTSNASHTLFVVNGLCTLDSLKDATCSKVLNGYNFNISYQPLFASLSSPVYHCDSNKTKISFVLQGNAPFTIYYWRNGLYDSLLTSNNTYHAFFTNGNYLIASVKDQTGCTQPISQFYTFNYQTLQATVDSLPFDCGLTSYPIHWNLQGNAPFTLSYLQNATLQNIQTAQTNFTQYLTNGNWQFNLVTDATGCVLPLSYNRSISNSLPVGATVISDTYDCSIGQKRVQLNFTGMPPYTLHYRRWGSPVQTLNALFASTSGELVLGIGDYLLDSVKDQHGCVFALNYTVINNEPILQAVRTDSAYHCSSSSLQLTYELQGVSPWTIYYHDQVTNQFLQQSSNSSLATLNLSLGDYVIDSVRDNRCGLVLNQSVSNIVQPIVHSSGSLTLSCDSQRNYIMLNTSGGIKPYTYYFNKDGNMQSIQTYQESLPFYMDNGSAYFFTEVKDAIPCSNSMNQLYTNNIEVPVYNGITSLYHCGKDSNQINFNIDHGIGTGVEYVFNNTIKDTLWINSTNPFYVPNGIYQFNALFWGANCVLPIAEIDTFDNHPLNFSIDSIQTDCSMQHYVLSASAMGESPWQLRFAYANDTLVRTLQTANDTLHIAAGTYRFISVEDANHCVAMLNEADTLEAFLTISPQITLLHHQLVSSVVGYKHAWYKNDSLLEGKENYFIEAEGNGNYYCKVKDKAGCDYLSLPLQVAFEEVVQVYPNPTDRYVNIHVNAFEDFWEYEVHDVFGNRLMEGVSDQSNLNVDLVHVQRGTYFIQFKVNGEKSVYRFTKL